MMIEDILSRLECEAEGKCVTVRKCRNKQTCMLYTELDKLVERK